MTWDVKVAGGDIIFPCAPDETILDAAERAGFSIPYSCRKGVCAACEGGLSAGSVEVRGHGPAFAPADGVRLCQARPRSHVEIVPTRITASGPPRRRVLEARVFAVSRPSPDVTVLNLRYPNGVRVKFRPGQHLKVLLQDGDSRNYSMANPSHRNDGAELHIRHLAGGRFSDALAPALEKGEVLRVDTPYGERHLDECSDRPVILAVTGTGFAPAKAIIEDQLAKGSTRPIHLYWGGRTAGDLYMRDRAASWAVRAPWLSFTPVLSRPEQDWRGRIGWVQHAVLEDQPQLAGFEVYACGNPAMTQGASRAFIAAGLDPIDFHCDAFVASADPVPTP